MEADKTTTQKKDPCLALKKTFDATMCINTC